MWTRAFWLAVIERAVKTFAQSLAALLAADGLGLFDIDWAALLSAAGLTTLASVLTSFGSGAAQGGQVSVGGQEVSAGRVVAQETRSGLVVAGAAFPAVTGTPVVVDEHPGLGTPGETPGDTNEADSSDLPEPDGFDDGSGEGSDESGSRGCAEHPRKD